MMQKNCLFFLLFTLAGCASGLNAVDLETAVLAPMPKGTPMKAPPQYVRFCERSPAECWFGADNQRTIERTKAEVGAQLAAVNEEVNRSVTYRSDARTVGRRDEWRVADDFGDCEDIALLKKKKLREQGWAPEALRLAIVFTPAGRAHAVLVAATAYGDFMLDVRYSRPVPWQDAPYRWFAREGEREQWELMVTTQVAEAIRSAPKNSARVEAEPPALAPESHSARSWVRWHGSSTDGVE